MDFNKNFNKMESIFNYYKITEKQQKEIIDIIMPIFSHEEFQIRMTNRFLHHGRTTLGEHILSVVAVTYKMSKKYMRKNKGKSFNLDCALKIAMMHDLYTVPWQNSKIKKSSTFYKHGFSHPIEAVINSCNWFNDDFKDPEKSKIIIDGIVHHMYPLPVLSFKESGENCLELFNYELINNMTKENLKLLKDSSNRSKHGKVSFSKCKYKEGQVMASADKMASVKQIRTISDATALITGNNKSLNKM